MLVTNLVAVPGTTPGTFDITYTPYTPPPPVLYNLTFDSSFSNYGAYTWGTSDCTIVSPDEIHMTPTPGNDSRIDLVTKPILTVGQSYFISLPVRLISLSNAQGLGSSGRWLQFAEDQTNPNWAWAFYVSSAGPLGVPQWEMAFWQGGPGNVHWWGPACDNNWHTISFAIKVAADNTGAYLGVWFDGVRQTFDNGQQSLTGYTTSVEPTADQLTVNCYTSASSPVNVTFAHGAPLIAKYDPNALPPAPSGGWNSP